MVSQKDLIQRIRKAMPSRMIGKNKDASDVAKRITLKSII